MGHLLNMGIRESSRAGKTQVIWSHGYGFTCTTRSFAVYLNGSLVASGSGSDYQSGTFYAGINDVIRIDSTSGASGTACSGANVEILRDTQSMATNSVTGFNNTATASYTINTIQAIWYLNSGVVV